MSNLDVKISASRPIHQWLRDLSARMTRERGRQVTISEVLEIVREFWLAGEDLRAELDDVNTALLEGGIEYPHGARGVTEALGRKDRLLEEMLMKVRELERQLEARGEGSA